MNDVDGNGQSQYPVSDEANLTPEFCLEEIELHKIFGLDANIEKNDNSWKVNVILKESTSPGGQSVKLDLQRISRGNKHWYATQEFVVDGVSFPDVFKNQFIFVEPIEKPLPDNEAKDMNVHLRKYMGSKGFDSGLVRIASLEDGDGLAAVFHEMGHTREDTPGDLDAIRFYVVKDYIKKDGVGFNDEQLEQVREAAEGLLELEIKVHVLALEAINYLREQGHDMYKDDEDLFRVKKFFITTTMARFNGAPKFIELVGIDKINKTLIL
jgi:hypothetical protein